MSKKSRYGPRTPLFDAVFGASVADLRERVKAPISDAVAEETVRTINRYFAPRGVKHALNAFRDEFHSIWNRYPQKRQVLAIASRRRLPRSTLRQANRAQRLQIALVEPTYPR